MLLDDPNWINSLSQLELSEATIGIDLPNEVDNSGNFCFPYPLYDQNNTGSCGPTAAVYYTFTYEINRLRGLVSNTLENQYPPNFVYNFLNGGSQFNGTKYQDIFNLLMQGGCPNAINWGNLEALDFLRWMDGYDKYLGALHNRLSSFTSINITTPTGLNTLKHWLHNHNNNSPIGGLACYSGYFCGEDGVLPPESAYANQVIRLNWSPESCPHGFTIVGYCDEIMYDFNGDGEFTNGSNMEEWEIGALKIVNNYATTTGNLGYHWIPYRLLALNTFTDFCYQLFPLHDYQPELVIKSKINHQTRESLVIGFGYGEDASTLPPLSYTNMYSYLHFTNDGGQFPMQGINSEPIEFALDFGYTFGNNDIGKVFQIIHESNNQPNGILEYFSLIDYRFGEQFELYSNYYNITIPFMVSFYGIEYDLIPFEINNDLTLSTNMIARFNPSINNATLNISDNVFITMYDSEIHINEGSLLSIGNNVTFIAKSGVCKLVIDGDITMGDDISFISEEDAQLHLVFNNSILSENIENAVFTRSLLISDNCQVNIYNTDFINSGFYGFNANFNIEGTNFSNSFARFQNNNNISSVNNYVRILENCTFNGLNQGTPLSIENYPNYSISKCMVTNCSDGIMLFNCGYGKLDHILSGNNITQNSNTGLKIYHSVAEVKDNLIASNDVGIQCLNRSEVQLEGNRNLISQQISYNSLMEVYATDGSFPYLFRFNAIIDDDDNCLVKYDGNDELLDVRYNYWGTVFNPFIQLCPVENYSWEPFWDPDENYDDSEAIAMFNDAKNKRDIGDYLSAEDDFKQLVTLFPRTKIAQAALKEIFTIEEFSSNDYNELIEYFTSEQTIQYNNELNGLAGFLVNCCKIKLENWSDAISWYENVIQNPESLHDSIFAIIDLGYTYFIMESTGFKTDLLGNMLEYVPKSKNQFSIYRDTLLSLLPGNLKNKIGSESDDINTIPFILLQNFPNPFSDNTIIEFEINENAFVVINLFNVTGEIVKNLFTGEKMQGFNSIRLLSSDIAPGIYFYTIEINGAIMDTKKMVIAK